MKRRVVSKSTTTRTGSRMRRGGVKGNPIAGKPSSKSTTMKKSSSGGSYKRKG